MSDNMDEPVLPDGFTSYFSKLVGVTFEGRQDVIKVLKGNEALRVRRESDNKYDPNAVAVDVLFGEEWAPIGYIAKDKNTDIARTLDAGGEVHIGISALTGGGDKSFGVNTVIEYVKRELPLTDERKVEKEVSSDKTPLEKLIEAANEYVSSGEKLQYKSQIFNDTVEVTVREGHISLPGYTSGSAFPKKFYEEFDEKVAVDLVITKHYKDANDDKKKVIGEALLDMWNINKNASTGYGTAIHAALENYDRYRLLGDKIKKVKEFKRKPNEIGPNKALNRNPFIKKVVEDFHSSFGGDYVRFNEQFVWLHDEKLAGSIDRIKVIDAAKRIVRIQDFKTDADIHEKKYQLTTSPFKKEMGNELLDLHWLQLSFYAYILQKRGFIVEGLDVYWLNPDKLVKGENPWEEFSHKVIDISKGL